MKRIKITIDQAKQILSLDKELRKTVLKDFTDDELGISELKSIDDLIIPWQKTYLTHEGFLQILLDDIPQYTKVDWGNRNETKFCISRVYNKLIITKTSRLYDLLAFNSEEIAEKFLEKHRDLIEKYYRLK